jgi:hypothetical protein
MSRQIAGPAAALVVLSLCLPAWGQGLGDAALRERQRRARAAGGPSSVPTNSITDEGLRGRAGQAHPEAASAPPVAPPEPASGGVSPAAFLRHLASAEAYLNRCERDLTRARERWLSASEASEPRAAEEARRAVEAAGRQLDRARAYRDEAETAVRRAGVAPVAH